MLSDQSVELLVGMLSLNLVGPSSAERATKIMESLEVQDLTGMREWLDELVDENLVIKKLPTSIKETVRYYVDLNEVDEWANKLGLKLSELSKPQATDWEAVAKQIDQLEMVLEHSDLTQSERSQAGAIISSLKILVQAPEPPKGVIRQLLQDLAALAAIFALAIQIAGTIL